MVVRQNLQPRVEFENEDGAALRKTTVEDPVISGYANKDEQDVEQHDEQDDEKHDDEQRDVETPANYPGLTPEQERAVAREV